MLCGTQQHRTAPENVKVCILQLNPLNGSGIPHYTSLLHHSLATLVSTNTHHIQAIWAITRSCALCQMTRSCASCQKDAHVRVFFGPKSLDRVFSPNTEFQFFLKF